MVHRHGFFGLGFGKTSDFGYYNSFYTGSYLYSGYYNSAGINLFTGDPGLDGDDRETDIINGKRTYITNRKGDDPDNYRAGIGYIGIGPFRFGNNTEKRRHDIQNVLVHDKMLHKNPSPHFKVIDRPNKFYFQFGSGGGYLW